MTLTKLSDMQIDVHLSKVPLWAIDGAEITRTIEFGSFVEAIAFVDRLAVEAEKVQHHPDIDIRYTKVKLSLSTHDAGGLTEADFDLAQFVDRISPA